MSELNPSYRWSVRLPQESPILDMLHEVKETSGLLMAELLEEAITTWYDALPVEEENDHDAN